MVNHHHICCLVLAVFLLLRSDWLSAEPSSSHFKIYNLTEGAEPQVAIEKAQRQFTIPGTSSKFSSHEWDFFQVGPCHFFFVLAPDQSKSIMKTCGGSPRATPFKDIWLAETHSEGALITALNERGQWTLVFIDRAGELFTVPQTTGHGIVGDGWGGFSIDDGAFYFAKQNSLRYQQYSLFRFDLKTGKEMLNSLPPHRLTWVQNIDGRIWVGGVQQRTRRFTISVYDNQGKTQVSRMLTSSKELRPLRVSKPYLYMNLIDGSSGQLMKYKMGVKRLALESTWTMGSAFYSEEDSYFVLEDKGQFFLAQLNNVGLSNLLNLERKARIVKVMASKAQQLFLLEHDRGKVAYLFDHGDQSIQSFPLNENQQVYFDLSGQLLLSEEGFDKQGVAYVDIFRIYDHSLFLYEFVRRKTLEY